MNENFIDDDKVLDTDKQQISNNVNSFRTVHPTIASLGHLTKLAGHTTDNIPIFPPKYNTLKIGPVDSAS